jgi:hypothetical protein
MSDLATNIKYMFETQQSNRVLIPGIPPVDGPVASPAIPNDPPPVPLERLEAQICELAGHLTAATCRFLIMLGDFDDRRGWASWDFPSCAAWLSWKCQMTAGTAREHVRVARALRSLPVIRSRFGAGRLSYAKVRALTRIATADTDAGLAEIAEPMTGNQLERFARAHRTVTHADDAAARVRRRLAWRFDDDGSLAATICLPPLQGAVLLKALRAAASDVDHPHDQDGTCCGVSAETPQRDPQLRSSASLADALLVMAESFLAGKVAAADNPDLYQVIIRAGTETLTTSGAAGVSAETPGSRPRPPTPASPTPSTRREPASVSNMSLLRSEDRSVQLEVAGHRVDELVVVGADGQAGPGRHAAELGQAPVGDQVHRQPGLDCLLIDSQQLGLRTHLDGDLAEATLEPRPFG